MAQNIPNKTSEEITLYNKDYISQQFTFIEFKKKLYKDHISASCLDSLSRNNSSSTLISQNITDINDTDSSSFYHSTTIKTPIKTNKSYFISKKNPFITSIFTNNEEKITLTNSFNIEQNIMLIWNETLSLNTFLVDIMHLKNEDTLSSSFYILSTFNNDIFNSYKEIKAILDSNNKIETLKEYMALEFNNDQIVCIYCIQEHIESTINFITFLDSDLEDIYKIKLLLDYYEIVLLIYSNDYTYTDLDLQDFKYNSKLRKLMFVSYNKLIRNQKSNISGVVLEPIKYIENGVLKSYSNKFSHKDNGDNINLEEFKDLIDKLENKFKVSYNKSVDNKLDEFYCNISREKESSTLLDTQCISKSMYI